MPECRVCGRQSTINHKNKLTFTINNITNLDRIRKQTLNLLFFECRAIVVCPCVPVKVSFPYTSMLWYTCGVYGVYLLQ